MINARETPFVKIVVDDQELTLNGLAENNFAYIVADGYVPRPGDGYDYRLAYAVVPLDGDRLRKDVNPVAIDPRSVEAVDELTQKRLMKILEEDLGEAEAT